MSSFVRAAVGLVVLSGIAVAGEVTTTLSLSWLTCAACSAAVTKALKQVEGVHQAQVSQDRRQAVVIGDGTVSPEALEAAVRQLGYGADVAGQ